MSTSRVLTSAVRFSAVSFAILLVGIVIVTTSRAEAFSLSGVDVVKNAGNTVDAEVISGEDKHQWKSDTEFSIISGAVLEVAGNTLSMSARYSSILAADRDDAAGPISGNHSFSASSTYRVEFTVEDPNNLGYDLTIDTRRLGDLTVIKDGSGNATLTLQALTATLEVDGSPFATGGALNENQVSFTSPIGPGSNPSTHSPIDQLGTLTLLNQIGTHVFRLDFFWLSNLVTSARDDAAIRLGIDATVPGSVGGDYPGVVFPRVEDGDGHLVDIRATLLTTFEPPVIVPEPAIGGLFAFAGVAWLAGLAGRRFFPRRPR